ncbi:ribonuclease E inhibitor RraB [Candidatus Enterovibrio escicola]|nr:ribonuclease E inhibitor RraB [Candidatus Enterovibrio escacola]
MSYTDIIKEQKSETRGIIAALLEDGSDPSALYTIEHHLSATSTYAEMDSVVVEAFKLGFEVKELEVKNGSRMICFDAIMETVLNADRIDGQVGKLVALAEKHSIDYDGWGTYFE